MKLGILCTISNTFGRKGFYNGQEIGLGKALAGQGHSVIIYKSAMKETKEETIDLDENLSIQYIHLPHVGVHGYINCHKYISKELDAILCFSDHQIFLPHVIRYCEKYHIKFVPYIGTVKSQDDGTIHGFVMNKLFMLGTLRHYRRRPVISKTEEVRKDLLRMGVNRVAVATVGIDATLLNPKFRNVNRDLLRQEFGFRPQDRIICCVGKLVEVKQPVRLIELMKQFVQDDEKKHEGESNLRMLIVGEGILKEQVVDKIREYGLENYVQLIDRIPYENMWKVYTMADYFLNVSRHEVFGMAILEAIYYETAVAAAPASGPLVILDGMKGHEICSSDEEFLAFVQEKSISKDVLREMSEEVLTRFTWDVCAKKFLQIVEGMPRVIINSDDFGLTYSCTKAIEEAFQKKIITDTTMVANGEAFDEVLRFLTEDDIEGEFSKRIGIHFVLTAGEPLTESVKGCRRIAKNGKFTRYLKGNLTYFFPLSKKEKRAIYEELTAQALKIKNAGIQISHADSHHHIHMNFQVAPIFARVCREQGIQKVRIHQNLHYKSIVRKRMFERYNLWLRKQGFVTTDYFEKLSAYENFADGVSEVMVHADFNHNCCLIDRQKNDYGKKDGPKLEKDIAGLKLSADELCSYHEI